MKILALQLARYGDIVLTLRSIEKRFAADPSFEVDLLVRTGFADIVPSSNPRLKVKTLDPRAFLQPISSGDESGMDASLKTVEEWLDQLAKCDYDGVINFSFSPLSSFICLFLEEAGHSVIGYSRHRDGTFSARGFTSRYFFSQVGVLKPNTTHLTCIFDRMLNVEDEICRDPVLERSPFPRTPASYALIHVGASEESKLLSVGQYFRIVEGLTRWLSLPIILVGSKRESWRSEVLTCGLQDKNLIDLVGKTSITELTEVVSRATVVIGCDSLVLQLSSYFNRPTFIAVNSQVNPFETGPTAEAGFVYYATDMSALCIQEIVSDIVRHLKGFAPKNHTLSWCKSTSQLEPTPEGIGFETSKQIWNGQFGALILSRPPDLPVESLRELIETALTQLYSIKRNGFSTASRGILTSVDELFDIIERQHLDWMPWIRWFNMLRTQIGPGNETETIDRTISCFRLADLSLKNLTIRRDDTLVEVKKEVRDDQNVLQI
ncbi:MAG: hypothetical protein COT74_03815 [Bdellovibrionales bacterium CG10_big_fil_rev_8_21_14_0_10_45_34]|nr:MAG: hypothetical protein COT74_03815 [Bdellovibrionales bacterium CG10_big_fil_rev_8_21_14_0_10_45_34]